MQIFVRHLVGFTLAVDVLWPLSQSIRTVDQPCIETHRACDFDFVLQS